MENKFYNVIGKQILYENFEISDHAMWVENKFCMKNLEEIVFKIIYIIFIWDEQMCAGLIDKQDKIQMLTELCIYYFTWY